MCDLEPFSEIQSQIIKHQRVHPCIYMSMHTDVSVCNCAFMSANVSVYTVVSVRVCVNSCARMLQKTVLRNKWLVLPIKVLMR